MSLLTLGMILFIGVHLLPTAVPLRQAAITRLGAGPYKGLFSLLSLAGLVLIVLGKSRAEFQPLWQPPTWGREVALMLMLPSLVLLAAANMRSNIKRFTRHPMLWGVTLWSLGHLLANGDLASLILFGGLGAYSLLDRVSANARGASKQQIRHPATQDAATLAAGVVA